MPLCRHMSGVEKGLQVSHNLKRGGFCLYQGGLGVLLKVTRGTTLLLTMFWAIQNEPNLCWKLVGTVIKTSKFLDLRPTTPKHEMFYHFKSHLSM